MSFAKPCGPSSDQPWIDALSLITNLYVPALSVLTVLPFSLSVIVNPGPSVPVRIGVAAGRASAPVVVAAIATATAARTRKHFIATPLSDDTGHTREAAGRIRRANLCA